MTKRQLQKQIIITTLFFLTLFLQGCALFEPTKPEGPKVVYRAPVDSRYKISVKSDGQNLPNLSNQLVHRVDLSREQFDLIVDVSGNVKLPFRLVPEADSKGEVAGVRVVEDLVDPNLPNLGIKDRDLITALGKDLAHNETSVKYFFEHLSPSTISSLTLLRKGEPHKIFYYVAP